MQFMKFLTLAYGLAGLLWLGSCFCTQVSSLEAISSMDEQPLDGENLALAWAYRAGGPIKLTYLHK